MNQHVRSPITGRGGGGKFGGGAGSAPTEAPNSLRSRTTARVIDLVSEGPIVGLVDGLRSVFFNGTALQNADGSFNFENVTVVSRLGTPDQSPISGFPAIETERPVGAPITFGSPVVRTISNTDADAVRFTVRIPALMRVEDDGDIKGTSVQVRFEARPNGGSYQTLKTSTISGKTNSPYERAYRAALPGAGPWDIRPSRLTEDSEDSKLQNATIFSSYTEIIDHKLIYPDSALFGVTVDAEAFGGQIPTRGYELYLLEIEVPSNYDPETRAYDGVWDGTFKVAWTDNPAWVFRDMVVNDRYGCGEFITSAQVDKWALYEIAQYCDALVPDGYGGMEPRFTFNGILTEREQAIRVITALAGVFRGMAHWGSGAIYASADMPADPVKLVTPANVVGDFNYEGTSLKSRHSVALVSWNDPANAYEPQIEAVEDPDLIAKYGYRPLEVTAVGCTSQGQAARYGKWALDAEQHESEIVNYQASFDHADLAPGDIIAIADPSYAGVRMGGRMVAINGTFDAVTIDDPVTLEAGETYELMIVMPDQTIATRALTNGAGETSILTLDTPLAEAPVTGALWIVSSTSVEPRRFRVISIAETDSHLFQITAIVHDPTKYARIEQGLTLEEPDYTTIPTGPLPAPGNPGFVEYLYLASGTTPQAAVTFSWSAAQDPRVGYYQVQVRRPDLDWEPAGVTSGLSIDIQNLDTGVHGFRVRPVSELGVPGPWLTVESRYLAGLLVEPADVEGFRISISGSTATLRWDPVSAVNLSHYTIRFSPETSGVAWSSSTLLLDHVSGTSVQVPAQQGTYFIKAVTRQGIYSVNAALVITDAAPINAINVVEVMQEDPVFPGVKTNLAVESGNLKLASPEVMEDWDALENVISLSAGTSGLAAQGIYEFEDVLDLGAVYTSHLTSNFRVTGENVQNTMASWATLASQVDLSGTSPSEWSFRLEIATTRDDPSGSPIWTDWAELQVADYDARALRFRAILESTSPWVTPVVDRLRVTVDMPDRVEAGEDIVVPPEGLRVDFTPPFRSLNGTSISAQGLDTGDYYELTNKDATGFDIRFFNAVGTGVARTFDHVSKGYGRVNA